MAGDSWDLNKVMKIVEREVDARKRASVLTTSNNLRHRTPTAATLVMSNSGPTRNFITCVYCGQDHTSNSCTTIADVAARREILRKAGRCYTCLKKHHLSKDCRSRLRCENCRGRHHVTICLRNTRQATNSTAPPHVRSTQDLPTQPESRDGNTPTTTNSLYAGTQTPILLQTARLQLINPQSEGCRTVAKAILDSGSQ